MPQIPRTSTKQYTKASLPLNLIYHSERSPELSDDDIQIQPATPNQNTLEWRKQALSIVCGSNDAEGVPPFTLLLLRLLSASYPARLLKDLIPVHLAHIMLRDAAVHEPMSQRQLNAWYEADGHLSGEVIVVGPAEPNPEWLTHQSINHREELSWDSPDIDTKHLVQTWVVVSTSIPIEIFLRLPPTLTYIGLINISNSVPIHKLPKLCPLLVVLDLSYTKSLGTSDLKGITWSRWANLAVLGLRGYTINQSLLLDINKGRWHDVDIIN